MSRRDRYFVRQQIPHCSPVYSTSFRGIDCFLLQNLNIIRKWCLSILILLELFRPNLSMKKKRFILAPAFQALTEYWLGIMGGFGGAPGLYCGFLPYYSGKRSLLWTHTGLPQYCASYCGPHFRPSPHSSILDGFRPGLPAVKQIVDDHTSLKPGRLYADKSYIDAGWEQSLGQNYALELLTPQKKQK